MTRPRRALCLAALLGILLLSGCVDYPPIFEVCLSCESGIEGVATDEELNVTVERSDLEVRVREDGSARWRVRADLAGSNVSDLADDPGRVDRLAERTASGHLRIGVISHYAVHGGDVRDVSARLDDRTLTVTYTVPSFGYRSLDGVVLVDAFHLKGRSQPAWRLGTDRLVVRGPPGTVLANDPPDGTVTDDRRAVVWEGDGTRVSQDTYLVFGDGGGVRTRAAAEAAVSLDVARWLVPKMKPAVHGSFLFLVAATIARRRRARGRVVGDSPVGTTLADLGGVLRAVATRGGVAVLALAAGLVSLAVVDVAGVGREFVLTLFTAVPLVPVALFGLLGRETVRDGRYDDLLVLTVVAAPVVMVAPWAATSGGSATSTTQLGLMLLYYAALGLTAVVGVAWPFLGDRFA